jgi:hypothetical protein
MRTLWGLILLLALKTSPVAGADLVEVARIGGGDTDSEYLFGRISFVSIARDSSVFVADQQLEQIRRYDPWGTFRANIGRAGEGPGEYRRIGGMTVLPSGELVVLSAPYRLTFFDGESGAYVRDFPAQSTLNAPRMLEYDNAGYVYVKDVEGTPTPGQAWSFVWLKIDTSGTLVDRIPIPKEDPDAEPFTLIFPEGQRDNFRVATKSAWSPRGYTVVGRNDRYAFRINHRDGETVQVQRDVDLVRLDKTERNEWQAWARVFGSRSGQRYSIPELKPAFRDLYVDADGRIWVHRYVAAKKVDLPPREPGDDRPLSTWREPNTFDVFRADGEFLGTVELPLLVRAMAWRADSIWGVVEGDDGEQLVHWRIRGW